MAKQNNTRLYILIALTIVSFIIFILSIIPNSPMVTSTNICMDNEKAAKMYASTDTNARKKFIEERNTQCKDMLEFSEAPKNTYEQLDTCNMVDSVMDASKHYMDLHKNDKGTVRAELKFLADNINKYSYCPQYKDVVKYIHSREFELK